MEKEKKEAGMQKKNFKDGIRLSPLGMGAMRLPQTEEGFAKPINEPRAQEIIDYCIQHGVNYFDTAYIYHGGQSETFLGKALKKYPRENYFVADKFNVQADPDYAAQFAEQLRRLQMERIDFYLLHGVTDRLISDYLDHGAPEYFFEQKRLGRIRYLGFSFHGSPDALRQVLKRYPWDFVQIQLNYYDWFHGTAREQYEILRKQGIPVMVMEPAHGGMLASLPAEGVNLLHSARPDSSCASWAFRFLRSLPGIAVILSGISALEQAEDNLRTFSEAPSLSEEELALIRKVSDLLHGLYAVPCTGCRYCCADCPQGLDIPFLLSAYNEYKTGGEKALSSWRLDRLGALPEEKRPSACIGCGQCTKHCPQGLAVPAFMKEMASFSQPTSPAPGRYAHTSPATPAA